MQRRLSTKWPLMIILMDYLGFCEEKGVRCDLDWRPRDVNVEADQLTNKDYSSFDERLRIPVKWEDLRFPMIESLVQFGESFSKRKLESAGMGAGGARPKFVKTVWG